MGLSEAGFEQRPGWGLSLATSGDFEMAIDTGLEREPTGPKPEGVEYRLRVVGKRRKELVVPVDPEGHRGRCVPGPTRPAGSAL